MLSTSVRSIMLWLLHSFWICIFRFTVVDLQYYPESIFAFVLVIGLFLVRHRCKVAGAPAAQFQAWTVVVVFALIVNMGIAIMPWVPPEGGIYAGDVSFFYATYCIVGLGAWVPQELKPLLKLIVWFIVSHYPVCSTTSGISTFLGKEDIESVKSQKNFRMAHRLPRLSGYLLMRWTSGTRHMWMMLNLW